MDEHGFLDFSALDTMLSEEHCKMLSEFCSQAEQGKLPPLRLKKNTVPSGLLTDGFRHYNYTVHEVFVHMLK